MTQERHVALLERQPLAGRDADLQLYDIEPGDHLGHRVFDLQPRVHLDEVELVFFIQKLERAGAHVADLAARLGTAFGDPQSRARVEQRRRRLFDHLLVAALHRALAVAEVYHILVLVGDHLDLDVPRILQVFLHVDGGIAECGLRFGPRGLHRVEQRSLGVHHAHAAPAAAAGGLDDHRVADLARDPDDLLGLFRQRAVDAGHHRHAGLLHRVLGTHLVAHQADGFGPGADEHEAALLDAFGEIGVLGEKAVAGMDRFGVGHFGGADDGGDIEIALRRRGRPDAHRLVGELHVLGFGIGLGVDDDGLDAHFTAGALDAQRDFAAVGDKEFFKH